MWWGPQTAAKLISIKPGYRSSCRLHRELLAFQAAAPVVWRSRHRAFLAGRARWLDKHALSGR